MTFGEKVKSERLKMRITQGDLAQKIGVTVRVISSYETDKSRPRGTDGYKRLADALGVNVNYLLSEDEAFIMDAKSKYGSRGAIQAKEVMQEVSGLFAGGDLADEDLDEMMRGIQEAYWIAKENNRKKFTPKKYRKDDAAE